MLAPDPHSRGVRKEVHFHSADQKTEGPQRVLDFPRLSKQPVAELDQSHGCSSNGHAFLVPAYWGESLGLGQMRSPNVWGEESQLFLQRQNLSLA